MKSIQTIGVIGGGQLGRMFALDAKRMGYDVITLDPQEHSPCGQVADEQIVAAYDDLAAIEELGRRSDVITYEFENIDIGSVRHLEALSYRVLPWQQRAARHAKPAARERVRARRRPCDDAVCGRAKRSTTSRALPSGSAFPAVLKTVRGGYDGKGQWEAASIEQAREAFAQSGGAELIFEAKVSLACELSVIATRNARDEIVAYPVAENTHDRGILAMTIAPARVERGDRRARRRKWPRSSGVSSASSARIAWSSFFRRTASCSSTRSRPARTTAATTRSTSRRARSTSSTSARSATCRFRRRACWPTRS